MSQGGRYDDEDQHRGDALQSPNEQTAKNADPAGIGNQKRQHRAQRQTNENPDNQAGIVVLLGKIADKLHEKTPSYLLRGNLLP